MLVARNGFPPAPAGCGAGAAWGAGSFRGRRRIPEYDGVEPPRLRGCGWPPYSRGAFIVDHGRLSSEDQSPTCDPNDLIFLAIIMNTNRMRMVVESFYADLWNRHDKSRIPILLRSDFTFRGSLGQAKAGHNGFASYVDFVHEAVAEFRCDILDLVIEEPKAFARMRFSGIHRGELFGHQPTGKSVDWAGAALFTFSNGQVAALWVLGDVHGLIQLLERNAHG